MRTRAVPRRRRPRAAPRRVVTNGTAQIARSRMLRGLRHSLAVRGDGDVAEGTSDSVTKLALWIGITSGLITILALFRCHQLQPAPTRHTARSATRGLPDDSDGYDGARFDGLVGARLRDGFIGPDPVLGVWRSEPGPPLIG
jgi:hypothetical protein